MVPPRAPRALALASLAAPLLAGCLGAPPVEGPGAAAPATLSLSSSAFPHGSPIPREYSCRGENVSPPLAFGGVPGGAAALALILDDPDAPRGTFTHWAFWDLPPARAALPRGADLEALGAREGRNDAGTTGYVGPCPPSGTHRYVFTGYALREPLGLAAGSPVADLRAALEGRVLARGELVGTFAAP